MGSLRVLSLCSGVGGLDLGLRMAVRSARTVCFVEREAFCCEVLATQMEAGRLDTAPVWTDLRTFDGRAWRGAVDCVVSGYPCQPFSVAGKRAGESDERHLWPEVARIIGECEPALVFLENVAGHLRLGFGTVLADLAALGFDAEWGLFRASDVGAPHRRERLFVLAYRRCEHEHLQQRPHGPEPAAEGGGLEHAQQPRRETPRLGCDLDAGSEPEAGRRAVADPEGHGRREREQGERPERGAAARGAGCQLPPWPPGPDDRAAWSRVLAGRPDLAPAAEQPLRGLADEFPNRLVRVDALRAYGNAVVPEQAALAFTELWRRVTA